MAIPDELRAAFEAVPVNTHLGFRLDARSATEAVVSMEIAPDHLQEAGRLHGGILTAMADTAAVYTFVPDLAEDRSVTSIEFKMNFLRPVLPEAGRLVAHAKVVRHGRRIGFCEVELTQSDRLVAKGTFTYLFL